MAPRYRAADGASRRRRALWYRHPMDSDKRARELPPTRRRRLLPLVLEVALVVAPLAASACVDDDQPIPLDAAIDARPIPD